MDLEVGDPSVLAGAVFFNVAAPAAGGPDAPTQIRVVDGQRIRLFTHATAVSFLTGPPAPNELAPQALELAQRALDLACITGAGARSLPNAGEQHVVWWRDATGPELQITVTRPHRPGFSVAGGKPPEPEWTPAMRFFRLSQLADDIFEACRNAFLALEAALDATIPPGAPPGEAAWLKYGLANLTPAFGLDMNRYLLQTGVPDPVQQFMDEQYKARRCAVFHAKQAAAGALLPGVTEDRRTVADALEPLVRLLLDISRPAFNAIFPAGGMTTAGFELALRSIIRRQYELALFDAPPDHGEWNLGDIAALSSDLLPAQYVGPLDQSGYEHCFGASVDVADLHSPTFNGIATYAKHPVPAGWTEIPAPGGLLSRHDISAVNVAGMARLHHLVRWVLDNRTMPKSRFSL
jgi:hypothetical protein